MIRFWNSTSRHHDVVAAGVDLILFQRSWRRPTDVLSTQVVLAVMTGTPNLFRVVAVLDYALEMRAHSRECFELSSCCMNQNSRLVPKLKDLSRINGDFAQLCRDHRVFSRLDYLRRRHKAEDGIKDCTQRSQRGTSQQVV